MYPLRLGTAISLEIFAHDTSGVAVTGIANGTWTAKRISKNSGAFASVTPVIVELEAGFYSVPITALNTDTLGILTMYFTAPGIMQINVQFRVEGKLTEDISASVFPAGAISYTYTVTNANNGLPIDGVETWFSTDPGFANIVFKGESDTFGVVRDVNGNLPQLDPGTYFIRNQKSGFVFVDDTEVVS